MSPLHDYVCEFCDKTFERLTKGERYVPCPICKVPAEKQVSACNFHLMGDGFYKPAISNVDRTDPEGERQYYEGTTKL